MTAAGYRAVIEKCAVDDRGRPAQDAPSLGLKKIGRGLIARHEAAGNGERVRFLNKDAVPPLDKLPAPAVVPPIVLLRTVSVPTPIQTPPPISPAWLAEIVLPSVISIVPLPKVPSAKIPPPRMPASLPVMVLSSTVSSL